MGDTTNTTKLRATIFPLRNISPLTHTYGFLSSIHPLDADGFAVPQNDLVLNVAKDKGYRYYSYIKDIEIIDILGLLKEQTAKLTSTLSMETTYFQVSKINLMSMDNVLLPSDFDGDNITEFNNATVLSDINFQYQNIETTDSEFIKYSGILKDETRDAKIRVTFTNGANSTSYDVYLAVLNIDTAPINFWADWMTPPQYLSVPSMRFSITHDLVAGGTYTMLADDSNFLKTLENSLPSLLNMKTGATIYSEKNILKKQKVTFTFKTALSDEDLGTDFSSLSQFLTRYGFERFGVAIHENGASILDNSYGVNILNPTNVLTYGICNYISHSLEENTITWSGYYYRLPRSPELFNLVKVEQFVTDPNCTGATKSWTSTGGTPAEITITRNTTTNADDVSIANAHVVANARGVLDQTTAYFASDAGMYFEVEIKNFISSSGMGVSFYMDDLGVGGTTTTLLTINKNGVYRVVIDTDALGLGAKEIYFNSTGLTTAVITFSITNVYAGVCL